MPIQHIGFDQVPLSLNQPGKRQDVRTSRTSAGMPTVPSHACAAVEAKGPGGGTAYRQLSVLYQQIHAAASTIRKADTAMKAMDAALEEMEGSLDIASKQYPPYPPGSEERVQHLRRYAALRVMIDRLSMPPREEAWTSETSTPAIRSGLPDRWTFLVGWDGTTRTVLKDEVHTGPSGIRIPELDPPEAVTDEALAEARERVGAVREELRTQRTRLLAGVLEIPAGAPDGFRMGEDEAARLSGELQKELMLGQVNLTHKDARDLEQLLG